MELSEWYECLDHACMRTHHMGFRVKAREILGFFEFLGTKYWCCGLKS